MSAMKFLTFIHQYKLFSEYSNKAVLREYYLMLSVPTSRSRKCLRFSLWL